MCSFSTNRVMLICEVHSIKNGMVQHEITLYLFSKVVFQQGTTKLSLDKEKTSITSDLGMSFVDPRTQNTLFSTDYDNHEFHLPKGVKVLNVQRASTERVCLSPSYL